MRQLQLQLRVRRASGARAGGGGRGGREQETRPGPPERGRVRLRRRHGAQRRSPPHHPGRSSAQAETQTTLPVRGAVAQKDHVLLTALSRTEDAFSGDAANTTYFGNCTSTV